MSKKRTCVYCSTEFDDNVVSREIHYRTQCVGYAREQEERIKNTLKGEDIMPKEKDKSMWSRFKFF